MNLRRLNITIATIMFAVSGLMIYWLARPEEEGSAEFSLQFGDYFVPGCELSASLNFNVIISLLLVFTLVTALFHTSYAANKFNYMRNVRMGNQKARWLEYSITATIMLIVISIISGVVEINSLILIGICGLATMPMGLVTEQMRLCGYDPLIPWLCGTVLLIGAYVVIVRSFLKAANNPDENRRPPSWVVYMLILMLAFYFSFGIINAAHVRIGSKRNKAPSSQRNLAYESAYALTSVLAKTTLVLFVFSGVAFTR